MNTITQILISTIAKLDSLHASNNQVLPYSVPGTSVTIDFAIPDADNSSIPIPEVAMVSALTLTIEKLVTYIRAYPEVVNHILLNPDDPYSSPKEVQSCTFGVTHWPVRECVLLSRMTLIFGLGSAKSNETSYLWKSAGCASRRLAIHVSRWKVLRGDFSSQGGVTWNYRNW